jgi:hypothetical protein
MGKYISFSQVDKHCGYQLRYYRERVPATRRSISLVYGAAVGEGIQYHVTHPKSTPELAIAAGLKALHTELKESKRPGGLAIAWDDPPRLTQGGRPYKSELHRIPNQAVAEGMLKAHVRSWIERFGHLRAAAVEEKCEIALTRPAGWIITGYLDIRTVDDGLIDTKTAAEPWDDEKVRASAPQLRYYQAWYRRTYGQPPAWTQFHVLIKGTTDIQVIDVPYDAAAINRWLEHVVRTNIAAIEAGAFVPNTAGYWHSERFCDYWHICPLGAAAHLEATE